MNSSDFLLQLKHALENELDSEEVKLHMEYYRNYIKEELRSGKTEQEVLETLGDPWAIAKTLQMSSGMKGTKFGSSSSETVSESPKKDKKRSWTNWLGLDTWWKKAAGILAVVAVLFLIFRLLIAAVPVLIFMAVFTYVLKMFRRK